MEILQLDIRGKFAHFRKYYANNTAMSFSLPPRTTIMGMLAAILGLPKDSYYEDFSSGKIRIGVAIKSPIKKTFHRLNFLSIKSTGDLSKSFESDFRGMSGKPIQTPFEVVSGYDIKKDDVIYRIFISCYQIGENTFNSIKTTVLQSQQQYSLSLGIAGFSASIAGFHLFDAGQIQERQVQNEVLAFNSAVLSESVSALLFKKDNQYSFVEEELLPADFKSNNDRELTKMNRVLFTTGDLPLEIKFSGTYYELKSENSSQLIQLLE